MPLHMVQMRRAVIHIIHIIHMYYTLYILYIIIHYYTLYTLYILYDYTYYNYVLYYEGHSVQLGGHRACMSVMLVIVVHPYIKVYQLV